MDEKILPQKIIDQLPAELKEIKLPYKQDNYPYPPLYRDLPVMIE